MAYVISLSPSVSNTDKAPSLMLQQDNLPVTIALRRLHLSGVALDPAEADSMRRFVELLKVLRFTDVRELLLELGSALHAPRHVTALPSIMRLELECSTRIDFASKACVPFLHLSTCFPI